MGIAKTKVPCELGLAAGTGSIMAATASKPQADLKGDERVRSKKCSALEFNWCIFEIAVALTASDCRRTRHSCQAKELKKP